MDSTMKQGIDDRLNISKDGPHTAKIYSAWCIEKSIASCCQELFLVYKNA